MTVKLLGAGLLALAGLLAGMGKRMEKSSKLLSLEDMDRALGLMAAEIEFHGRPLPELFARLAEKGPRRCRGFFAFLALDGERLQDSWSAAARQLFDREEAETLAGLGAVLGRYEGERQAREIEAVRQGLKARAEELRAEITEKAKNYPALGLCAGAVMGIMVM